MANFKLADKETLRKYLEILKRIKRREMSNANKINLIDSDIAIMETILELPMCESSSENESMDEFKKYFFDKIAHDKNLISKKQIDRILDFYDSEVLFSYEENENIICKGNNEAINNILYFLKSLDQEYYFYASMLFNSPDPLVYIFNHSKTLDTNCFYLNYFQTPFITFDKKTGDHVLLHEVGHAIDYFRITGNLKKNRYNCCDELNSILLELLYTFLSYDGFYRKLIFENRFSYTSESLIALTDYFLLVKDFEKYDSSIKTDDFRKLLIDYLNEELLDSDQDASTLTDEELIAHYKDYYLDTDVITDLGYLIGLLKSLELLPIIIDDKKRGMKILKRELNLKQNCNIVDPQKFKDNVNNLRL